ncbi:molybdenum cofactor biosynthesis protein MoaE [uncultured Jatrophihabitans sp.]|uniref:molybdenum cofactor biosynthesis protein MoaE n=1 Tax=uncultured Jatrophihabitans sp. TaxID=1610747 RepID=UPI0035CABFF2
MRLVSLSDRLLEPALFEAAVEHDAAGARAVFCGVVRSHDLGRDVRELEYVAYPSAQAVLAQIAERFAAEPDVTALAVGHRVGLLAVGDVALVAVVATAHRRAAFDACARLVDEVKEHLPVWKRQVFADGTDEWVNCP